MFRRKRKTVRDSLPSNPSSVVLDISANPRSTSNSSKMPSFTVADPQSLFRQSRITTSDLGSTLMVNSSALWDEVDPPKQPPPQQAQKHRPKALTLLGSVSKMVVKEVLGGYGNNPPTSSPPAHTYGRGGAGRSTVPKLPDSHPKATAINAGDIRSPINRDSANSPNSVIFPTSPLGQSFIRAPSQRQRAHSENPPPSPPQTTYPDDSVSVAIRAPRYGSTLRSPSPCHPNYLDDHASSLSPRSPRFADFSSLHPSDSLSNAPVLPLSPTSPIQTHSRRRSVRRSIGSLGQRRRGGDKGSLSKAEIDAVLSKDDQRVDSWLQEQKQRDRKCDLRAKVGRRGDHSGDLSDASNAAEAGSSGDEGKKIADLSQDQERDFDQEGQGPTMALSPDDEQRALGQPHRPLPPPPPMGSSQDHSVNHSQYGEGSQRASFVQSPILQPPQFSSSPPSLPPTQHHHHHHHHQQQQQHYGGNLEHPTYNPLPVCTDPTCQGTYPNTAAPAIQFNAALNLLIGLASLPLLQPNSTPLLTLPGHGPPPPLNPLITSLMSAALQPMQFAQITPAPQQVRPIVSEPGCTSIDSPPSIPLQAPQPMRHPSNQTSQFGQLPAGYGGMASFPHNPQPQSSFARLWTPPASPPASLSASRQTPDSTAIGQWSPRSYMSPASPRSGSFTMSPISAIHSAFLPSDAIAMSPLGSEIGYPSSNQSYSRSPSGHQAEMNAQFGSYRRGSLQTMQEVPYPEAAPTGNQWSEFGTTPSARQPSRPSLRMPLKGPRPNPGAPMATISHGLDG